MWEFVWTQEIVYKRSAHIREQSSAYVEIRETHTVIIKVGAGYTPYSKMAANKLFFCLHVY